MVAVNCHSIVTRKPEAGDSKAPREKQPVRFVDRSFMRMREKRTDRETSITGATRE